MRRAVVWGLAAWMVLLAGFLALRAAKTAPPNPGAASVASVDPALAKCRAAGEAGGRDPACLEAWRMARARFFGRPAS
jgi:conjugative transfer region protein TrbK